MCIYAIRLAGLQDVVAAHPPREDVGSHTTDFGAYGDDVLSRAVGAAADMTQTATTHDLAVGTVRATKQVPGKQNTTSRWWLQHISV